MAARKARSLHPINTSIRYSATKLQQIMVLHTLSKHDAGLYVTQICISLREIINKKKLQLAWDLVSKQHDMLRSAIDVSNNKNMSVQVYAEASCVIQYEDITAFNKLRQDSILKKYLFNDQKSGFDFRQSPLMRLMLFKLDNERYELIWSHHHAILAGGSVTRILHEVFVLYDALCQEKILHLPPVPSYGQFVKNVVENIDYQAARFYWRSLLKGFNNPNALTVPNPKRINKRFQQRIYMQLSKVEYARLKDFALKCKITINTVVQAGWALLLAKYTGAEDVVFGSVRALVKDPLKTPAGLFINILPVRVKLNENLTILQLLQNIRQQQIEMKQFLSCPLDFIQKCAEVDKGTSLFETCVDYKPQSIQQKLKDLNDGWNNRECKFFLNTNLPLTLEIYGENNKLYFRLVYSPQMYSYRIAKQIIKHVKNIVLDLISDIEKKAIDINMIDYSELTKMVYAWNNKKNYKILSGTVVNLFEKQVVKQPNAIAVTDEFTQLTYADLNAKANKLAIFLVKSGVKNNSIVGVCLDRGVNAIVAILGVIKAGAAYLPIDSNYPDERISYILHDSKINWLITEKSLLARMIPVCDENIVIVDIAAATKGKKLTKNLSIPIKKDALAYVIYTSGSTGNPKGVMIAHRGLTNLVCWHHHAYKVSNSSRASCIESFSFDAAVWSMWSYITAGASLHIATIRAKEDIALLEKWLVEKRITHCFLPTGLAEVVLKEKLRFKTVKYLLVGGDILHYTNKNKSGKLFNHYGPTENTVVATAGHCVLNKGQIIGKPISNVKIYILDAYKKPVPINVKGEIFIGGAGVAIGYLNNKKMTEEKFTKDIFSTGKMQMYQTGDLARWLPNGDIEYIGRKDNQVKIRGFRIELEEIELALLQHPSILQCAVLVKSRNLTDKYLVAYLVSKDSVAVTSAELRSFLLRKVPEYMLPNIFIVLSKLPTTQNGKLDRKALPEPADSIANSLADKETLTDIEVKLLKIWVEVFGNKNNLNKVTSFFDLGGDSISALQIVAKSHQVGLNISSQAIFQYLTIEQLAKVLDASNDIVKVTVDQKLVVGEVGLTPIQHWFFDKDLKNPGHFNQTCLLHLTRSINIKLLKKAFLTIIHQHDALRMQFEYDRVRHVWHEINRGSKLESKFDLQMVDLSSVDYNQQKKLIDLHSHIAFKLNRDILLKAIYFKLKNNRGQLLIIIHHLIIDVISWRIFLEDLHDYYQQFINNNSIAVPGKSTSFKYWSELLTGYANRRELKGEVEYWLHQMPPLSLAQIFKMLHVDYFYEDMDFAKINIVKNSKKMEINFNREQTINLLTKVNAIYNTKINDILLCALVLAFAKDDEIEFSLELEQEEHGREIIVNEVDLSRTVGWFTSIKPLLLKTKNTHDLALTINAVKDYLAAIPHKGIYYGILKYLSPSKRLRYRLAKIEQPKLGFNYLGQFIDNDVADVFRLSNKGINLDADADFVRDHVVDVDGLILNNKLKFIWTYNTKLYKSDTVFMLANRFKQKLLKIIAHCVAMSKEAYKPADFPLLKLDSQQLNTLVEQYVNPGIGAGFSVEKNLSDMYPMTSMQNGFMFHALYNPTVDEYFIQHSFSIESNLDPKKFYSAWQDTINNYEIFRTGFIFYNTTINIQFVLKRIVLPWKELDWTNLSAIQQASKLAEYKLADRQISFDVAKPPLARASLIKLGSSKYAFIISYHHILLDGWSWALVVDAAFKCYGASIKASLQLLPVNVSYKKYVEWLLQQDETMGKRYWQRVLAGFHTPIQLSIMRQPGKNEDINGDYMSKKVVLSSELTERIIELAKYFKITVSTFIQSAWTLLLSCYGSTTDLVYGMTVANRPLTVFNSDTMVGLMVNTLPVRIKVNNAHSLRKYFRMVQKIVQCNQEFSYCGLADILKWNSFSNNKPLFDILFLFENYPVSSGRYNELNITESEIVERIHYKLVFKAILRKNLEFFVDFNGTYFLSADIERLVGVLVFIIEQLCSKNTKKVADILWLDNIQFKFQLECWNRQFVSENSLSLLDLFFNNAKKYHTNIAIYTDAEELTYLELTNLIKKCTNYFLEKGIRPGNKIGVCLGRTSLLPVVLLTLLRLGAAYLPLDPYLPRARLEYILNDAKPEFVIIEDAFLDNLPKKINVKLIRINKEIIENNNANISIDIEVIGYPAYILYTSGSTGKPKGVIIGQRALVNFFNALASVISITQTDILLSLTTYTFDIFGLELYFPLLHGASVVLAEQGAIADPEKIKKLLSKHAVSIMQATPVTWRLLLNAGWDNSQPIKILSGGEALNGVIAAALLKNNSEIYNLYGPTEATIWSTWHKVTAADLQYNIMPIGKPFPNTKVFVLDAELRPVPVGVVGELYIGGTSLAQGYLEQYELTQARFIHTVLVNAKEECVYKTGDLVKWLPNGDLLYVARTDDQVKIHGFRIELSEIEACLLNHQAVKQCVVLVTGTETEAKHLVAYIVPKSAESLPTSHELRAFLQVSLPYYMLPAVYLLLESLPLTVTNKIDKKALVTLNKYLLINKKPHVPAKNVAQKKLITIFAEVLEVAENSISINDNFFDLGGDSILAIHLLAKIQRQFSAKLTLRSLLEAPTLLDLFEIIKSHKERLPAKKIVDLNLLPSPLITLQAQGDKRPLFLIHPIGGTVFIYSSLVKELGKQRPVYAIQDPGIEAGATLFTSFKDMANYYVKEIKKKQSCGPYLLAGASFGANMAVEVAHQLKQQGEQIEFIGLIDGWALYPAKVNNDREWFESNLGRQHQAMRTHFQADFELPQTLLELNWHRQQLLAKYELPFIEETLRLYKSATLLPVLKTIEATYNHWDTYTSRPIKLYITPGNHETMLLEPNVQILAAQMLEDLEKLP